MARSIIFANSSATPWTLTRFGSLVVPATDVLDVTDLVSDDELISEIQKGLGAEFDSEHFLRINGIDQSPEASAAFGSSLADHPALRQLVHFIDNGPAEGFLTGSYREVTGDVFPTAIVWYDNNGESKKKIVEKLIAWTGANPTTITWKIYDDTETLLATVTDTITYSGPFETSRLRAIA